MIIIANEIVKYGNQLNDVPFRNFKPNEINLFFAIVSRMRDKQTSKVTFSFEELKELSNFKRNGNNKNSFYEIAKSTYSKMLSLNMFHEEDGEFKAWVLFTDFEISSRRETILISVNPELQPILNDLVNWTRFGLEEFVNLRSSYSKTMFRLLKQYRTTGIRKFKMEEFRNLLDIPNSYRVNDIDSRVLNPIKEELSPIFAGLKITKLHKGSKTGRGSKIIGYKFVFKKEEKNKNDFRQIFDNQIKIDNVKNNGSLTDSQKGKAIDKILKLPIGTTKDLTVSTLEMIDFRYRNKKRRYVNKHNVSETLPKWADDDKNYNNDKSKMPWERY